MSDIVRRLLTWTHARDAAHASDLMEEAAEEITKLRSIDKSCKTIITGGYHRTVTSEAYEGDIVNRLRNWRGLHLAHGGDLFEEAADTISSMRLSNEEKEALVVAIEYVASAYQVEHHAKTLANMVDRLTNYDR